MKITKVEAIELRLPESEIYDKASGSQDALIVKIHTDEGIVGIGEIDSCPRVAKAAIDAPFSHSITSGLGRILIGMNPLDVRVINEKLYQATFYYGRRGVVVQAIGGIDIALWDIAGKYYKQPIYKLLGGAFQKKIRAYASILFGKDGNETCEIGKRWVDRGFTAVKFGWAPMGQSEKLDLDLVEGARRGVGDSNDVLIDAGCCWDTMTAIRRARQFEDYKILWLEEPLDQDNLEGYKKLTNLSRIPIAAGEGDSGRFAWRDLIERGEINIAQVDLARNGFTEAARIADMAEDHGLKVVNHFYTTGINLAAGLHWLASRKTAFIFEYCVEETPIRLEVTKQKMEIDADGFVHVPEGPGLGIDLNEETIEKY
ncbi:MAG: mandelate racemase/muconate lactonizing enzyme family protein, partial [Deltaproteobacteria bacterium]|nr:mandelate racemase/muconate lactonizing enzyme family protein [Deltaproteobacteria bacterium]